MFLQEKFIVELSHVTDFPSFIIFSDICAVKLLQKKHLAKIPGYFQDFLDAKYGMKSHNI